MSVMSLGDVNFFKSYTAKGSTLDAKFDWFNSYNKVIVTDLIPC